MRELMVENAVDTIRIRIQTYPGALVPPLKQLIPKPRLQNLYAGESHFQARAEL